MTRRLGPLLLAAVLVAACADLIGVRLDRATVTLVPRFAGFAQFGDNADQLRIVIQRDTAETDSSIKDTIVAIDPVSGQAAATFTLAMFTSPQLFRVRIDAIRSSDGVVLFGGTTVIAVNANETGTPPAFEVPGVYVGPTGAVLSVTPADTAVAPGVSFPLIAQVLDTLGQPAAVPVTFALADAADSTLLAVSRLDGIVTTAAGADGEALVVAQSADGLRDTARVLVGSTPAAVRVTPGVAHLTPPGSLTLVGEVLDGGGNVLPGFAIAWTSRDAGVATVTPSGQADAVAVGGATIVATFGAFADSTRIIVAPAGNVVGSVRNGTRFYRAVRAGDTVFVDLVADMQFAGGELLGSYNATLGWNPAVLQYEATLPADWQDASVNPGTGTCTSQLCIGDANPTGSAGLVTLARIRFRALAAGQADLNLAFSEMSAAVTFTNLITRVTVAAGAVTVVP